MGSALEIVARVTVPADPERVWRIAMDWSRQHEWIWATRVSGGQGAGAEVTGWTGIGPVGFTDTMVIT
ncbi:MAG TPA: SRPBCC family protein, partial [Streptosporangiaceae bacterium]